MEPEPRLTVAIAVDVGAGVMTSGRQRFGVVAALPRPQAVRGAGARGRWGRARARWDVTRCSVGYCPVILNLTENHTAGGLNYGVLPSISVKHCFTSREHLRLCWSNCIQNAQNCDNTAWDSTKLPRFTKDAFCTAPLLRQTLIN